MAFVPKTLDYTVSPYTGLTRQSWIEAGTYLLEGVFQNIANFEDPVVMPRKETKVTCTFLLYRSTADSRQSRPESVRLFHSRLLQVTCTSCMYKGRSSLSRSL